MDSGLGPTRSGNREGLSFLLSLKSQGSNFVNITTIHPQYFTMQPSWKLPCPRPASTAPLAQLCVAVIAALVPAISSSLAAELFGPGLVHAFNVLLQNVC